MSSRNEGAVPIATAAIVSDEVYPRLLGRAPATSTATAVAGLRRVRFSDEPEEMAQDAQAACLAMRHRVTTRNAVDAGYPRLLGCTPAMSTMPQAAWQRCVHLSGEPRELAQSARAACLATQQRVAARALPARAYYF